MNKEKKSKKTSHRYFLPTESTSKKVTVFEPDIEKYQVGEARNAAPSKHALKSKRDLMERLKTKEERNDDSRKFQSVDFRRANDPFPGDAPIPKERIKKYERGRELSSEGLSSSGLQHNYKTNQIRYNKASKQAARTEILLPEEEGFLEFDEDEDATKITQQDIADSVDIASAEKHFDLNLNQFGPYHMNYTRNGRFLLLGGNKGHCAAIDWPTKKLMCEMNVMETVHDVKWLHIETMFAVAQKQWTYIYDNQGIELHCLKLLDSVLKLEFLPYHFLLVAANAKGYLSYIDVSIGQKVTGVSTGLGRLGVMCQNPSNAIIHLGHFGGKVSLWSPNVKEPLVKMLCHSGSVRALTVDKKGNYMATSGVDRTIKIWDIRTYKMLQSYKVNAGASTLAFSQTGLLAAGIGSVVQVFRDCCEHTATSPYLQHQLRSTVQDVQFCPYEDVLGVSHGQGFSSLLVPGAGVANYDAMEENPFQTKKQRQHAEVNMLLEKIQPDLITLDTSQLGVVDAKTLQDKLDERNKLLYLKPKKVEFEPRHKMKGKSKSGKLEKRKKGVIFERKREQVKEVMKEKQKMLKEKQKEKLRETDKVPTSTSALDRFQR